MNEKHPDINITMKKLSKILTVTIASLGCLHFTSAKAYKPTDNAAVVLYEQNVGNLTNEETDNLWHSNNPRSWVLSGIMDGEIIKKYKAWHNRYKNQVKGTTDERGLDNNTDLTIHIKNLNINSAYYKDIRLIIDYLSNLPSTCLTKTNSFELYVTDSEKNRYGPYNLADFETTGFYMRKTNNSKTFERNFNIITENIKIPKNARITELEIRPYSNYPRFRNTKNTLPGNWRGADGTLFKIAGMKILGYKNTTYHRPDYIKTKNINVNRTREKIVKRMYDLATVRWIPSSDFHDTRVIGFNPKAVRTTYKAGNIYYGPPYTQRNRVPLETFANKINNGLLAEPDNILRIWGADCSSSVSYSISKYIPLHAMYNTADFIWDKKKTSLLGNLSIDGKEASSEDVKKRYSDQDFYEAYAKLQKGDIVSTHYKKNTHVRLITGSTHVERQKDNTIDPLKSYFIRTDIRIGQANTTKNSNDFGGLIDSKDYVVPFEPKSNLTDIKDFRELESRNLNFYINKKTTFKEAFEGNYLPLTLKEYKTAVSEEPYVRIINANTDENIGKGLKGTIFSNYTILNVDFKIKNFRNGKTMRYAVYPNHDNISVETGFSSIYSLYYNTPRKIQDYVKEQIKNSNPIEITISVSTGEKTDINILTLNYHPK